MRNTKIQWCHSTTNPVMGCDGCELWPGASKILQSLKSEMSKSDHQRLAKMVNGDALSQLYANREALAVPFAENPKTGVVVESIRRHAKCYAGLLGTFRGGVVKGYAAQFEKPEEFPGRIEKATRWAPPHPAEISAKPWLRGLPRLIFVSDMGDALSSDIRSEFLRQEIIGGVTSPKGLQHVWLWLTKRPTRMAKFGQWLAKQGIVWPDNLVAMTTVTSQSKVGRVDELRRVPSKLKGLSLEPLFGPLELDLTGISWVIVGGGSDVLAEPFHCEWALDLKAQCEKAGVAFFVKQLGKRAFYKDEELELVDSHGGDWSEWPEELRCRQMPEAFRAIKLNVDL